MRVNKVATAAVFFMAGIGLSSLGINWIIYISAAVSFLALLCIKHKIKIVFALIIFIVFLSGAFYYNFRTAWEKYGLVFGEQTTVYGVINSVPERSGGTQRLIIKSSDAGAIIGATTYSAEPFEYGDLVKISGSLSEEKGGKISFSAPTSPKILKHNAGSKIKAVLFALKDSLQNNIKRALPPDKTALAIGTLLGDKSDFTKEFNNALKRSGLAHIAALSGFNVMIFVRYLSPIVGFFILHRGWRFGVTSLVITAFIVMTGASASLVRAGIMGIVGMVLKNQSRLTDVKFVLIWTALLMVLADPAVLVFDLGFSLSFAALIGLIYIEPLLKKWLVRIFKTTEKFWSGWKGLALQTVAAEAAVSPIIFLTFRQFSPWAIFSNLLIIPLLPATMFMTFLVSIVGYISSVLSAVFAWPLYILVSYEELVINFFGRGFI